MNWSRQPIHAKEFVKPISLIPALLLTEPQALPGYSHVALPFRFAPLLSNTTTSCPPGCATRNCQVYERDISITGGLILVLHSRPCSFAYTYRRAVSSTPVYSVRSARVFASGFLQPALTRRISAMPLQLPFHFVPLLLNTTASLPLVGAALSTCDWTNSLI